MFSEADALPAHVRLILYTYGVNCERKPIFLEVKDFFLLQRQHDGIK
jgi:hypothetical protein